MEILYYALEVCKFILLARVILSWVPNVNYRQPIVRFLYNVTEPVLKPIQRLIPPEKTGYIDLSPLFVFFAIQFLQSQIGTMLSSRVRMIQ